MKPYIYAIVIIGLLFSHYKVYDTGRMSVIAQLRDDRIEVLKNGKRIDESVLIADDATLLCMLTNCKSD